MSLASAAERILCSVTSRTIFPDRKIGSLEEGSEATFLVLRQNPLDDLQHLRAIKLRCKRGRILDNCLLRHPTERRWGTGAMLPFRT